MALGTLEILALILIIVTGIRLIILAFSPKKAKDWRMRMFKNPKIMQVVYLILAAIVLYILISAGITIVQIIAVSLFVALTIGVGIAPYAQDILKKMDPKTVFKDNWLYLLIWIALLVWGLIEIFF